MTMDPYQILVEKDAIRELKARYFRFLDTKQWDRWTEVFEPEFDHEMEYEQQKINGPREEFVAFVSAALADTVTVHHGHNPEIQITSPTTATAIWPFVDRLQPADHVEPGKGVTLTGYGHYHETYVKSDSGWRIKTQRVTRLRMDFGDAG